VNAQSIVSAPPTPTPSGTAIGSSAAFSCARIDSSSSPATVPGFQSTRSAFTPSIACPKVRARTATPVETTSTSVTPGMSRTSSRFRTRSGVPFRSGARQMTVGSASGTFRSVANFFRPVTIARASVLFCGLPMIRKSSSALRTTSTCSVVALAAFSVSSPNGRPLISPRLLVRVRTSWPRIWAAAASSRPLASAAATRIGV
jgi:hypothetical protein